MKNNNLKIWGSPGTGKTTTLINLIEEHTKDKKHLNEVVFCTYRKNMATDFVNRLKQRYKIHNNEEKELMKYFGTIHATCLKRIRENNGINKVVDKKDIIDFCNKHKISVNIDKIKNNEEEEVHDTNKEENIFNKYQKIRSWCVNNLIDFKDCTKYPTDEEPFSQDEFRYYDTLWEDYKTKKNLIDFDDMLLTTLKEEIQCPSSLLIIDEFQDLSPIQHAIYTQWKIDAEIVYIAGDPNQAIYSFTGATPAFFNKSDLPCIELNHSYRLPSKILEYSFSILEQNNLPKPDVCSNRTGGNVKHINYDRLFDVLDENRSSFILCRANYLKDIIRQELEERGVFYTGSLGINQIAIYDSLCLLYGRRANITWHSFQIFLNVIRAGFLMEQKNKIKIPTYFREHQLNKETAQKFISPLYRNQFLSFPFDFCSFCMSSKITKTQGEKINNLLKKHNFGELPTGKIEIMTIHGSKGREAQDVFVLDAQTPRIEEACFESKDAAEEEARVFYVACTRSKEQLYIVDTSTLDEVSTQYKLPN